MTLENIINEPENACIADRYRYWNYFMENEVNFTLENSKLHTHLHCSRVLFLVLKLAETMNLSERDKDILSQVAVFHDSRRNDDGLDVGHGKRAAEYYMDYCMNHGKDFIPEVFLISAYHDQNDSEGIEAITNNIVNTDNCLLLYKVFKDADALDRFRLGPNGLDKRFLRNNEAPRLIETAKELLVVYGAFIKMVAIKWFLVVLIVCMIKNFE